MRILVTGSRDWTREHGELEAALMWPQLSSDELHVLARLVRDMDERERDAEDADR